MPSTHSTPQRPLIRRLLSADVMGHPVVWALGTGGLILLGALWLKYYAQPQATRLGTDTQQVGQNRSSQWQSQEALNTPAPEELQIEHTGDQYRADTYREQISKENQLAPLLDQARLQMQNAQFAIDQNNGAWFIYQQILAIDPNNNSAKLAVAEMLTSLPERAESAMQTRRYDEAEHWLSQLDLIQPEASFQNEIREGIRQQIQADLNEEKRLALAQERENNIRMTLDQAWAVLAATPPEPRAALDLFQTVMSLQAEHPEARKGIDAVYQHYQNAVTEHIAAQNWSAAQANINQLEDIQAPLSRSKQLREDLRAAVAASQPKEPATPPSITPTTLTVKNPTAPTTTYPQIPFNSEQLYDPPITAAQKPPVQLPAPPASTNILVNPGSQKVDIQEIPVGNQAAPPAQLTPQQQLITGTNAYYRGDYVTAFEHLHPLAKAGNARAQFRIGIMYYQGRTVVQNQTAGVQWISRALPATLRAAQQGQSWAEADLGTAYELGIGVPQDKASAANWYIKSANRGYPGAQANLGAMYGTGDGIKYDRQLALYWLKKAADKGDKIAQDNLDALNARN